jgi:hypothetical protein
MSLPWFAVQVVHVKTYPVINDHGAEVVDYTGEPIRRPIAGCSWQPSDGHEEDARREATMRTGRLYMPAHTDIDGAAIVEVEGKDYTVVGDPADWSTAPFHPHVVAVLERWEG